MRRPLRQMLQHVVAGQVDQQRRDRYLASGNRVKVRARATVGLGAGGADPVKRAAARVGRLQRSEEHTSELQSLMRISYVVFWLKKKKQQQNTRAELERH